MRRTPLEGSAKGSGFCYLAPYLFLFLSFFVFDATVHPAQAGFFDDVKKLGSDLKEIGKSVEQWKDEVTGTEELPAKEAASTEDQVQPAAPETRQTVQPAPPPPAYNSDKPRVAKVQNLLNHLGYEVGVVDGLYGTKTRGAIQAFQLDRQLPPRGDVTDQLIARLQQAAQSEQVPTGASNQNAVAKEYGLHVVRGLPVVAGERHTVLTEEQIAAASQFFDFVELGLDPGMVENNPACWARKHLPKNVSDKYLLSGAAAMQSQSKFVMGKELLDWKGANEFEKARTKQAFLSDHAGDLKARAVAMPLNVFVIDEMTLPRYDRTSGGFDLRFKDINTYGVGFNNFASRRIVSLPHPLCAGGDFQFLPAAVTLPEIWQMNAARAEEIVRRLDERKIYIAFKLRFRKIQLAKTENRYRPNRVPVTSAIISVTIYEDADLERPIETLSFESAKDPVMLTGLPEPVEYTGPTTIDGETLALAMLRNHGDVLDAKAWRQLMVRQTKSDQAYYSRKRKRETGNAVYTTETQGYDPKYVPFFPNGFKPPFRAAFTEAQIALFKEWTMQRVKHLPNELIFRATLSKYGNRPAELRLPVVKERVGDGFVTAVIGQGYSVNQILRPDVNPVGVGAVFDDSFLAGPGISRNPALILPNIAIHYVPAFSDTVVEQIFEGSSGSRLVEVLIKTGPSKLVPVGDTSEAFVLHGAPKRIRIYNNDASEVLFEHQYEVVALDPNRLDVGSQPILPSDVEALPLSAEVMDLLTVKHLADSVSDEDYRQMMVARWEYEAAIPPEKGEPDWGRFFVPGKPKPTEAQQAAMLTRFKEWTVKRAAALPGKFRLYHYPVQITDGKPISVFASGIYQLGELDPNSVRIMINSCTTNALSYPALATACGYLDNVYNDTPAIYPFGLGYQMAGPRLRCRAALGFGSRETYCSARQAQFEKMSSAQIKPGFREVLVYDKEIFFPGTQSDAVSLGTSGIGMIVDISIASARIADKPLPVPFTEARNRYEAYRQTLGLESSGWVRKAKAPSGTYFIFDAKVLSAHLVKGKAREPIADLELRPARTPDLDSLEPSAATAELPDTPFGPEIAGLRLGMTFEDADKIVRSHMQVGKVLTSDRANDSNAITGSFEKFTSSKIYIAEDNSEFIVLYDEPPAAPKIVLGITRQISLPKGQLTPGAALVQLRKKYGKEDWVGNSGQVGWGKALRETTFNDSLSHQCLPSSGNRSPRDWLEEDGSPSTWNPTSSRSLNGVPNMTMYTDPRGRNCGAVLGMDFSSVNDPSQQDRLILQLTDPHLYRKYYEESQRLIKSGEAVLGAESSGVKLKF